MGSGPRVLPRGGMKLVLHRRPQQLMPGRVELDLVAPAPEAVMGLQPRRVLVGGRAEGDQPRRARQRPDCRDPLFIPLPSLAADSLTHPRVGLVDVVVLEWRGLVEDLMRARRTALGGGHPPG